ncbi:MAG: zinc-ribbon domain-containing protein [Armatimonadetes bacterium]|nr:zinc-ribbon domain-containing protein [Armatimonadota bacterium]MDE2207410.1 zinc-ribbon domain-containing protein [Armatimonadota bacterium]
MSRTRRCQNCGHEVRFRDVKCKRCGRQVAGKDWMIFAALLVTVALLGVAMARFMH